MHSFVLQDWITIRGIASNNVIQGESTWLDLAPYQDVTLYLDVREVSTPTAPSLQYQTAPIKDESLFQPMMATPITLSVATAVTHIPITTTACPIARYLRWQLIGPGTAWDTTFRVLVAASALGL